MNISITVLLNSEYYREAYSETIKTRVLKKYQVHYAISMIVIGVAFLSINFAKYTALIPLIIIAIGCIQLFIAYYSRKKWIDDRLNSKLIGKEVEMTFTDTTIKSNGPFSQGEISWRGIKSIEETEKGFVIRPETGIVLYIPKSAFHSKEDFADILSKVNNNTTAARL